MRFLSIPVNTTNKPTLCINILIKVTKNILFCVFFLLPLFFYFSLTFAYAHALALTLCRYSPNRAPNYRSDLPRIGPGLDGKHPYIDNVTKTNRSLFNSWRSGGALSGTSSNNHTNHFSDYSSFHTTTSTQIMATSSGIFRDCTHISFSDTIKSHNNVTFKLVKTGKSLKIPLNF